MGTREPIAIVGMGCRFASASSPEDFWKLLIEGQCTLGDIPPDRFPLERYYDATPGTPGRIVTRQGGYLEDIRGFDARFFRVSNREAEAMDPQQRHLLEVSFNALQDAGLQLQAIDGARAGIYVGLFTGDYRERSLRSPDFDRDVYTEIGSTRSSTAGRIAYAFNLTGPTVAVDAACASSLVAVHMACNSIWSEEVPFALAAGCNVILEPETSICFSRSKMLSPESRCKFGDASANGFVRSEGIGVVVLKPLRQALRDNDRIYSVIRETGVNNDARQGGGLYMTPGRAGQVALLKRVYQRAQEESGLPLERLAFVEAHGTGTKAGDPVECGAIAEVLGTPRQADTPLYLGSVKTNIGHTEGAAGIASLIKATLSLYHRTLPPSLHLKNPNPDIPWAAGHLEIPTSSIPLAPEGPVMAGVSSFGLSGTNAHVVLETFQAPSQAEVGREDGIQTETQTETQTEAKTPDVWLLPLSAHLPEALRDQAVAFSQLLSLPEGQRPSLPDLCYTAASRRCHLEHRLAVLGGSVEELKEALTPYLSPPEQSASPGLRSNRAVFVFSGQGGQWAGMGNTLYQREPVCRAVLEELEPIFLRQAGWSLREAFSDVQGRWNQDISKVQPLIFAVQVALARLWLACGITPAAVVGHSMGEVAAAAVAGILSLEDAVTVICARSRLLGRIRGQGRMAVVALDEKAAAQAILGYEARVGIAVSNSRSSSVLSGDPQALDEILATLTERGIYCSKVDVDVASHSPQTDPLLEDLRQAVAHCRPMAGNVAFYSTVDAEVRPGEQLDADYWASNMRCAVRFAETSRRLLEDWHDLFIEVGPHPVLVNPLLQTIREEKAEAVAVGSMRRDELHRGTFLSAVASVYMRSFPVKWDAIYGTGTCVTLPPYPFQHEDFWFKESGEGAGASVQSQESRRFEGGSRYHPLLSESVRLGSMADTSIWEIPLSTTLFPHLADHRVRGSALLPGAAYVGLALSVAKEAYGNRPVVLEGIELREYLTVPTHREQLLQVQLQQQAGERAEIRFYSFDGTPETGADAQTGAGRRGPSRLHAVAQVRLSEALDAIPSDATDAQASAEDSAPEVDRMGLALLREQLGLELERRKHNARHPFALLSLFVASDGDPSVRQDESAGDDSRRVSRTASTCSMPSQRTLTRRLRELLRQGDVCVPVRPGQFVMLLRGVARQEQLQQVGRRISTQLLDSPSSASPGTSPLFLLGTLATSEAPDADGLLNAALEGRLPPLEGLESGEAGMAEPARRQHISPTQFYETMALRSIEYGATYRPVTHIETAGGRSRATLQLPDAVMDELGGYLLHPAVLDGCFQAAVAAFIGTPDSISPETASHGDTWLPVGIGRFTLHGRPTGRLYCHSRLLIRATEPPGEVGAANETPSDVLEIDFSVTDDERRVYLEVEGLRLRRFERRTPLPTRQPFMDWIYRWQWKPAELPVVAAKSPGRWILVTPEAESPEGGEQAASHLQAQLEAVGGRCQWISSSSEGLATLAQALTGHVGAPPAGKTEGLEPLSGLVILVPPGTGDTNLDGEALMSACISRCLGVVETVNRLAGGRSRKPLRLWLVTSGAWAMGSEPLQLEQAPLWGLGRVLVNERPDLELRMVDLSAHPSPADLTVLATLLRSPDAEDEVAIRDGARLVHRLTEAPLGEDGPTFVPTRAPGDVAYGLYWNRAGEKPSLRREDRTPPGPGELELLVHATAFDLGGGRPAGGSAGGAARAGILREDLDFGLAGVVTAVGEGVSSLAVGDAVMAYVPCPQAGGARVRRYARVSQALAVKMPVGLTFMQAATLPALELPARLAIQRAGSLAPGERLLVRGASSGVGMATALLAQRMGAQVFATAPGWAERDHLRTLGLKTVLDSHSPELGATLRDLTGGEGVDGVIDAGLLGASPDAWAATAAGGRVVTLVSGFCPVPIGLEGVASNVTVSSLDVAELSRRRPDQIQRILARLAEEISEFDCRIVASDQRYSIRTWVASGAGLSATGEAPPRGPRVIDLQADEVVLEEPLLAHSLFERQASYLITGGTGGLGLEVARWMGRCGAGTLVLLSRSGMASLGTETEAQAALEAIRATGAQVQVLKGDVGDQASLAGVFAHIDAHLPTLRGVFHLAGILDDATLERQDEAHFVSVMRPKLLGAWNLHQLTRDRALTHCVYFSSAATTLGSPGQANYAAANGFLDGLAAYRKRLGLAATSVNWGTWADAGLAAAQDNRAGRLEARGLIGMASSDAIAALEQVLLHTTELHTGEPGMAIFAMDWNRWARAFPRFTRSPRVAHLVQDPEALGGGVAGGVAGGPERVDLKTQLRRAELEERQGLLLEYLRQQVAEVLRMPASRLGPNTALGQLGMDSLMTVELRGRLAETLGVELSPTRILGMPHLTAMATAVLAALRIEDDAGPEGGAEAGPEVPDMPEVVHLDPTIVAQTLAPPVAEPTAVLLTGVTGFLGAHVLRELLDQSVATVYCLVRAQTPEAALRRIRETLTSYQLWHEADIARIVPLPGDLEQERFGYSLETFERLAAAVQSIYHCAAHVNHLYPYERLEAANVWGTQEVLRLASVGQPLPVHHVSTIAVFPFTLDPANPLILNEEAPLQDQCEPFFAGYSQSKWMAERLIEQARARGLNVTIYRPGAITGSTHAGICPDTDVIWRLVQAAAGMGMAPGVSRAIGLTPVDFVARAMVALSRDAETVNRVFHVFAPKPYPIVAVIQALRSMGYPIQTVSFAEWRQRLVAGVDRASALYPLLSKLLELDFEALDQMRVETECRETVRRLEATAGGRSALSSLTVTPEVMRKYLEHFQAEGTLPVVADGGARGGQGATSMHHEAPVLL